MTVKEMKGKYYYTDIMDDYAAGTIKRLSIEDDGEGYRKHYCKVTMEGKKYLLKSLMCQEKGKTEMDDTKGHHPIFDKLSKLSPCFNKPLNVMEKVTKEDGEKKYYLEELYYYNGKDIGKSESNLSQICGKSEQI